MKKTSILLLSTIIIVLLSNCKEKFDLEEQDYPIIYTNEVEIITDTGIVVTAEIKQLGNSKIIDCGFVWATYDNFSLSSHEISYISIGALTENDDFIANINYELVNEKITNIRAYCKTENEIVYGNIVSFDSKGVGPPVIYSFSPLSGLVGDNIIVTGNNFISNIE